MAAEREHRRDVVWTAYLVCAVAFATLLLFVDGHYPYEHVTRIVAGTERRPFVFRILMPYLIAGSAHAGDALGFAVSGGPVGELLGEMGVKADHQPICFWTWTWGVATTWATLIATRATFLRCFAAPALAGSLVPLIYLVLARALYADAFWIYDLAAPLMWLLGVELVRRRQLWPLLGLCMVGTLNKETIALVAGVHALSCWRDGRKRMALWSGALLIAGCVLVRLLSMALLDHGRPHTAMDNNLRHHLMDNLKVLASSELLLDPKFVVVLAAGALLLLRGIGRRPPILQNVMAILPIYVVLWLYGGRWWEVRVFNELLPFCSMLLCVNVLEVIRERPVEARAAAPMGADPPEVDGDGRLPDA